MSLGLHNKCPVHEECGNVQLSKTVGLNRKRERKINYMPFSFCQLQRLQHFKIKLQCHKCSVQYVPLFIKCEEFDTYSNDVCSMTKVARSAQMLPLEKQH